MKKPSLPVQIILGLLLGIIWALVSSTWGWSNFTLNWIAPFGQIFINLLKLIAIPLVLFSIISGIANLSDTATLGRMGVKTLTLYIGSTILAASVGMVLANTLSPGKQSDDEQRTINRIAYEMWVNGNDNVDFFDEVRLSADPANEKYLDAAQTALAEQQANEELNAKIQSAGNTKDARPLDFIVDMVPSNIFLSFNQSLMIQVIFFALFFGITMVSLPNTITAPVSAVIDGFAEIFIKMVDLVMRGAPFFVFALLAGKLAEMAGDEPSRLLEIFKALGAYTLVTIVGLLFLILLVYPAVLAYFISRKSHFTYRQAWGYFSRGIRPAQLLAFSTSSTAATLPVTMDCVHDNLGVDEEVGSFVLPVGATVNMDGTALYQTVAVIFMAQFHMIDLSIAQQMTIIMTATLASIGAASVPSAGLIMLIVVLESVGLNPAWIAIIFPVDRIIDMVRTVLNLTGDASVATLVAITEGKFHPVKEQG